MIRFFIITLCLIFISTLTYSQNFETIPLNIRSSYIHSAGSDSVFKFYHPIQDSITVNGISFKSYSSLDDNKHTFSLSNMPWAIIDTSWMGYRMIKLSTGDEAFLNEQKDSIFFKNNIQLNDTWLFYRYANGNYLNATLSSVIYEPTLGINDSIRILSLQMYDSSNQAIADTLNSITFEISKQFGFKKMISLRNFPFEFNYYLLHGIDSPALGIYNLQAKEIFDYEIGDVFHYESTRSTINTVSNTYIIRHITNKQVYSSGDSIVYTIQDSSLVQVHDYLCQCQHNYFGTSTDVGVVYNNTWTLSVSPRESADFSRMPYSAGFSAQQQNYRDTISLQHKSGILNGRVIKDFHLLCYHYFPNSMIACNAFGPRCEYQGKRYAQGLGFVTVLDDVSYNPQFCYDELVYYRKGSEIWGTPANFSLLMGESEHDRIGNVIISPNPFYDSFKLNRLPIGEVEIVIYNSLGDVVKVQRSNYSESAIVLLNELKAGIYFAHIVSADRNTIHKLVKL